MNHAKSYRARLGDERMRVFISHRYSLRPCRCVPMQPRCAAHLSVLPWAGITERFAFICLSPIYRLPISFRGADGSVFSERENRSRRAEASLESDSEKLAVETIRKRDKKFTTSS